MTETPERRPGPEDEGIPDHADDTSTAYDEADRPRFESPAAMPAEEPQAVEEPGVTGPGGRDGESLDQRLAREQPAGSPDDPWPEGAGELTDEVVTEQTEQQAPLDADVLGVPDPEAPGYEPADRGGPVGRLVEPDEGARPDTEPALLADDAGPDEGGAPAEEDAVHEITEEELRYEP